MLTSVAPKLVITVHTLWYHTVVVVLTLGVGRCNPAALHLCRIVSVHIP